MPLATSASVCGTSPARVGVCRRASVRPRIDGSYRIRGLPPAEYWIAATQDVEASDLLDPTSLERLVAGATRVRLTAGETKAVDLQIGTPNPAASVAAARRHVVR